MFVPDPTFEDEAQVICYLPTGGTAIIRGTPGKVHAVMQQVLSEAPATQAFFMQDTPLASSASLVDNRTPSSPAAYQSAYPNREYNEP